MEDFERVLAVTETNAAQGQVTYWVWYHRPSGTLGDFPHLKQQVLVRTINFFLREEGFSFFGANNTYFKHRLFVYNTCFFSLRLNRC